MDVQFKGLHKCHTKLAKRGIDFPQKNLINVDVILDTPQMKFDVLVGNPPWANFTDLPSNYKERLKPLFHQYSLVSSRKNLLLGSSRIDIAALVLEITLGQLLVDSGEGHFFVPLSLFSGEDAHKGFRDYLLQGKPFCVSEVYEFSETAAFPDIGTSYCYAHFRKGESQVFPIKYFREESQRWKQMFAHPLRENDDPWIITSCASLAQEQTTVSISLKKRQKPRQGINTCGANDVFIFSQKPSLPDEFLFPLVTKDLWKSNCSQPQKWLLLPYNRKNAKPLTYAELSYHPSLLTYLEKHKEKLISRKGTLIQTSIQKGFWWALLGIGPYSFAPFKVVWEAYGKQVFQPRIIDSYAGNPWQPNQAMQAFIPCWDRQEAERIQTELQNPQIHYLLKMLNGGGKCNWAQPGKIKKILNFEEKQTNQMSLF